MNLYDDTILIESKSLDDRLALVEKKENNIMKQYEINEETIRNLKSNMNAELDVRKYNIDFNNFIRIHVLIIYTYILYIFIIEYPTRI